VLGPEAFFFAEGGAFLFSAGLASDGGHSSPRDPRDRLLLLLLLLLL